MILTKELKKYIKSLQYVKFRQKYNKFVAEGPKICFEFLESKKFQVDYIICTETLYQESELQLSQFMGRTIICNDKELKSISSLKSPNKILIVCHQNALELDYFTLDNNWAIYCDKIQDPGNMGTIMRVADWFGISSVLSSSDSVDFYNPKIIQSAMGAHNRVSYYHLECDDLITSFKDQLVVMSLEGQNMESYIFQPKGILVVGNESKGVRDEILKASTQHVTITKKGGAESLNASVACGIACHFISLR